MSKCNDCSSCSKECFVVKCDKYCKEMVFYLVMGKLLSDPHKDLNAMICRTLRKEYKDIFGEDMKFKKSSPILYASPVSFSI